MNCRHTGVLHTELGWLLGIASLDRGQEGALQYGSWGGKDRALPGLLPSWSLCSVRQGISGGFQFSFLVTKCRWQLRLSSGRIKCHAALRIPRDSITDCTVSRDCCTLGIYI